MFEQCARHELLAKFADSFPPFQRFDDSHLGRSFRALLAWRCPSLRKKSCLKLHGRRLGIVSIHTGFLTRGTHVQQFDQRTTGGKRRHSAALPFSARACCICPSCPEASWGSAIGFRTRYASRGHSAGLIHKLSLPFRQLSAPDGRRVPSCWQTSFCELNVGPQP